MGVVDKNSRRLHQYGHKSDGTFPAAEASYPSQLAIQDDSGRDVNEIFGDQDRCPHVYFKELILNAAGGGQGEPARVND